jgi:hypothetical protein
MVILMEEKINRKGAKSAKSNSNKKTNSFTTDSSSIHGSVLVQCFASLCVLRAFAVENSVTFRPGSWGPLW